MSRIALLPLQLPDRVPARPTGFLSDPASRDLCNLQVSLCCSSQQHWEGEEQVFA